MATARVAIENKIVDILDNAASLSALARIFRGVPYDMKYSYMPCVEVAINSRTILTRLTGNNARVQYDLGIRISDFEQELITSTAKTITLAGHESVGAWADLVQAVLEADANVNLQSLTFTNGSVCAIQFASPQEYGIGALVSDDSFNQDKADNLFNFAFLPFVVETLEDLG